jgi:Ring finger domain
MTAECPICYIPIEYNKNCVTTDCGHKFHCSCLMTHSSINGFNCPYCRCKTAEAAEDSEEEYEESDEEEEIEECDCEECMEIKILKTFRMFHQRIEGEHIEGESDSEYDSDEEEYVTGCPPIEYVTEKLLARGYNLNQFIHYILVDYEFEETNIRFYSEMPDSDYKLIHGEIADIINIYRESLVDPRRRGTYHDNLVN